MSTARLPPSLQVIERGWLSSNSILCYAADQAAIIDTGYVGQAAQTLDLVNSALAGRRASLQQILNTHSHSDHMGGNALLKDRFACPISIPAGVAEIVHLWDEEALLLAPAGQRGERFAHDALLHAGDTLELGGLHWNLIAAPGHDMHALMFHCPQEGILISGDALWQDGFGVVFGELLGQPDALPATRATLETIETLDVTVVIPGHGPPFSDVAGALARAQRRLQGYEADKPRLARNAIKALLTFNLLDHQRLRVDELPVYLASLPFFTQIVSRLDLPDGVDPVSWLVEELLRARAVAIEKGWLLPLIAA